MTLYVQKRTAEEGSQEYSEVHLEAESSAILEEVCAMFDCTAVIPLAAAEQLPAHAALADMEAFYALKGQFTFTDGGRYILENDVDDSIGSGSLPASGIEQGNSLEAVFAAPQVRGF